MAQMVNDVYTQSKPDGLFYIWLNMLNFCVLLSANLGVMNLLPLPALDGGRLVFLLLEVVRGKPIPPQKEGFVHMIGMVCLMVLMAFIFYNDLTKIF
ncbi:MAG: site-2 protease family protein, partial [Lachnospiraceae bacterium]|nr:site-2 protease family protein [Lachnospiraceae bacterium]